LNAPDERAFDAIKENAPTAFEEIPNSIYVWCRTVPTA
jgi:hypothetical protein